jgi:hypothetical protein
VIGRTCRGKGASLAWLAPDVWGGQEGGGVYWTMSIILFVLWALGMISGSTEGYWVYLLLLFSLVTLILAVAQRGRRLAA